MFADWLVAGAASGPAGLSRLLAAPSVALAHFNDRPQCSNVTTPGTHCCPFRSSQEEAEGGLSYGGGGGEDEPAAEAAGATSTADGGSMLGGSADPASPRLALPPGTRFPSRQQLFPKIAPSERCGECKACLNPKLKKACLQARKKQLESGLAFRLPSGQFSSPSSPRAGGGGGGVGGKRATAVATAAAVAAGQALGPALIGCRVRVYWEAMRRW